ncbi:cytochrome P450 [Punctularia strigosozonata HHB-11173 SS5]|uniref:cytochrome P450 n=1 Tax=Punctularia strigosozonata (strain HHB-11173) TaxID=741275 RepID=UPI0004417363|nr:cytochrome P450 [Punctularia strigosozonata HHB-11173 SS5]EIN09211.1 cytochrome P450 [Punctularia strigosozonata HHB-11173 SS5]
MAANPTPLALSTGLLTSFAFRRFEPRRPLFIFSLLFIPPLFLAAIASSGLGPLQRVQTVAKHVVLHLASLVISTVAYRVSPFHPLAKYPGPWRCKVTRLWALKIANGGNQHRYYHALHEKFGPVVRSGPNHLHVRDRSAIPIVMGREFRKGGRYESNRLPGSQGALLTISDPHLHSQRRRIWERAFTPTNIKEYEEVVRRRANELVKQLRSKKGSALDLSSWITYLSFDVMGDVAYGGLFNLVSDGGDKLGFIARMNHGVKQQEVAGTIEWLAPFVLWLPQIKAASARMYAMGRRALDARMKQGTTRRDLFYYLLDEDKTGNGGAEPLNDVTLMVEASFAIVAGSDTTGTALSNAFYYLLTHPPVYRRLQGEVDAAYANSGDGENVDPAVLSEMPYLNAVINETLRMQPALPNGVQRRKPFGSGDITVGAYRIPAGTTVQIPSYSIHRDPRYFYPEPNTFIPERWITGADITKAHGFALDKDAYIPFSYGATNCVGRPLALLELRAIIATLVHLFDFTLAENEGWSKDNWEKDLRDAFVLLKGPLMVTVRERL